ncbi:MAG: glucohydrolase, partial [Blautia sp.]|nr:glucohydrolase [Blautia sp.]
FSSMYDFTADNFGASEKGWYDIIPITPDDYRNCVFDGQKKAERCGFYSNIIENHDEPRGVSRYIPEGDVNDTSKKALATVLFFLRGLPFIYQGQELGMENVRVDSIEEVDDISTIDEYQVAIEAGLTPEAALNAVMKYSRDNARTPFQWTAGKNAGFTDGIPWIKVNPDYKYINLERQIDDPDSVYQFYRTLIQLRKDPEYKETIVYGDLIPVWEDRHNLMAFTRCTENQTLLIAVNFQNEPQTIALDAPYQKVILNNYADMNDTENEIILKGYQAVVILL